MNACAVKYRKKLTKSLTCCGASKKQLTDKFDNTLSGYLEDYPNATEADLTQAFGTPQEMAASLNRELDPKEVKQFRKKKIVIRIVAAILAAVFVFFAMYVFFEKQKPLTQKDDFSIVGQD